MATAVANILVVDDEPIIRSSLAEVLTQEGFAVTACGSAEEALLKIPPARPDVVLMDIHLPGESGIACSFGWNRGFRISIS